MRLKPCGKNSPAKSTSRAPVGCAPIAKTRIVVSSADFDTECAVVQVIGIIIFIALAHMVLAFSGQHLPASLEVGVGGVQLFNSSATS